MKCITMEEIHNAIIHTPTQVKDTSSIFDVDITTDSIASHFAARHKDKFIMQNKNLYHYNGVSWKCEETRGELISINKFIREVYYNELSNELQEYERDILKRIKHEGEIKGITTRLLNIKDNLNQLLNVNSRTPYIK